MESSPETASLARWGWLVALGLAAMWPSRGAEAAFYAARVAPILDKHCVVCHGAEKARAGLRLDSFEHLVKGAESGEILRAGDAKGSELHRRITLAPGDDEVMPSDGKPLLSPSEIKAIELWIAAGASPTKPVTDFPDLPRPAASHVPLAPDWRPRSREIVALEEATGLKLVPRSQVGTDGLILRTAGASLRCDDAALAKLAPIAALIVDAELARTRITDAGLETLAHWKNLHAIDLTRTSVTSAGLAALAGLKKLERLNLTETKVDAAGVAELKPLPSLKRVWLFGTKAEP